MMGELQLTTTTANSPNNHPIPIQTLPAPPRSMPAREDCWSEDATFTLIEAWGQRYIDLNRGNLRQKQWQEVADTVNARHGHVKKARRTDIQCKNRIDTLKKKYKIEKARVLETNGSYKSPWPFFENLDQLIGNTTPLKKNHVASGGGGGSAGGGAVVSSASALNVSHSPPYAVPLMRINPHHHHQRGGGMGMSMGGSPYLYANAVGQGSFGGGGQIVRGQFDNNGINNGNVNGNSGSGKSLSIGVSTPVLPQKRTLASASVSPSPMAGKSEEYFRRNYAAVAAAAAREEVSDEESEEEEEVGGEEREVDEDEEEEEGEEERGRESKEGSEDGIRKLARVIEKFGEVYARVEREKQKQLIELEKQRMQFAKELECQRMQMLVEMQVQLEKIKRAKRSNSDDMYS